MKIGVLAVQGAFIEHEHIIEKIGHVLKIYFIEKIGHFY